MSQQQHLPPFPFGGSVPFQPTQHQTSYNNMPATNPAPPPSIPQMQQAAFTQNSQLPGFDMATVLQGITPEQLAYIGQLYQSGLIPLPSGQASPAAVNAVNANMQPAVQQNGMADAIARQEEDPMIVDKDNDDREDGEVSPQREPDFLHPPPTGPRKRSGSVHMRPGYDNVDKRAKRQPSPLRQPKGYDRRRPEPRTDGHNSPPRSQFRQRKAKQDAAKDFVLAMYRAGYAFDDIAREVGDARVLRVLFTDLGLNAPSEKPQLKQLQPPSVFAQAHEKNTSVSANATLAQKSPLGATKPKPVVKPIIKPVAVTKAPATADRSAYLAKLQAAKNKKNEALLANTDSSPAATPATSQAPQVQQASAAPVVAVQAQPTPSQPKKAKVQTELIRQRLEALKGEQARRQEAERLANAAVAASTEANVTHATPFVNPPVPQTPSQSTNSTPQTTQLPASVSTLVAQQPPAAISMPPVAPAQISDFTSQFPGLPGLFMTGTPPQISAGSQIPVAPSFQPKPVMAPVHPVDALPSKLSSEAPSSLETEAEAEADSATNEVPVPAKQSVASSGQATPKHPFNQNRYDSNDDSVIIHVSDDDDEESEIEEESEDAPSPVLKSAVPITKPGPLRNFPAPSFSANASTPTTPGATTPGGSAYERKLQEINEMHRRIAEMQKQPRKAKATLPSSMTPAATSVIPTSSVTHALPGLPTIANNVSVGADVAPHPVEQQQRMEAKLAQLEEEAETISEQRQAASQASLPIDPQQVNGVSDGVPDGDSTTSNDDDDAMDLSSGDELEPEEPADDNEPGDAAMDIDSDSASIALHSLPAKDLATMSHSGSDSDDSSTDSEDEDEDSEDDYEPAPAVVDVADVDANPVSANPFSQGQALNSTVTTPEVVSSTPTSQMGASPQDVDLAPELQPSRSEQAPSNATPEATTKPHYKPYESPLRMFRDYRYHPKFTSDVQGGFKSLTYSNKLDPIEAMCPNELSNGTCQDQSCLHQHFHNTAINDAELLKELGTRNAPWKTEEERIRWSNGLSEIIKQLRDSNQGTDVNAIAARIAQYRRDFVGTPDQILNLNPASAPR